MTRDDRGDREALDALRNELEAATPAPTAADRAAILAACEPALAENARAAQAARVAPAPPGAVRPAPTASFAARLGTWLGGHPARFAAVAAAAAVLAIVLLARAPATREARSAPLRTWAEHVSTSTTEPGRSFPVAVATFGRPY